MSSTAEDSNEKHLSPWSEACEKDGIETTPLSPFLDQVSHQQSKNIKDVQGAGILPANYENDHWGLLGQQNRARYKTST